MSGGVGGSWGAIPATRPDHAAGFADAVPDEATDGAIDFLAFVLGQAKRVENDFIQFGAVRQWLK